jgi:hypothetical protein
MLVTFPRLFRRSIRGKRGFCSGSSVTHEIACVVSASHFPCLEPVSAPAMLPKVINPTYSMAKNKLHKAVGAKDRAYGAHYCRRK